MIVAQPCGTKTIHAVRAESSSLPCVVYGTACGLPTPAGSWGVYEVRGQKINCSECIEKETDMTTVEETSHADTVPPEAGETNGHAVKPKRGRAQRPLVATLEQTDTPLEHPATVAFRQLQKDIEDAQLRVAELTGIRDSLLGEATRPAHFTTSFTSSMTSKELMALVEAPSPRKKSDDAKPGRKPRENSVPQQVLTAIPAEGAMATYIAARTGLDPKAVHSGLHQLMKAGRVRSKGSRRDRVWSVKP